MESSSRKRAMRSRTRRLTKGTEGLAEGLILLTQLIGPFFDRLVSEHGGGEPGRGFSEKILNEQV